MWLEVISLRTSISEKVKVQAFLMRWLEDQPKAAGSKPLQVFNRPPMGTDFAIHLSHKTDTDRLKPSSLGLQLADCLREFGPVSHSLWNTLL